MSKKKWLLVILIVIAVAVVLVWKFGPVEYSAPINAFFIDPIGTIEDIFIQNNPLDTLGKLAVGVAAGAATIGGAVVKTKNSVINSVTATKDGLQTTLTQTQNQFQTMQKDLQDQIGTLNTQLADAQQTIQQQQTTIQTQTTELANLKAVSTQLETERNMLEHVQTPTLEDLAQKLEASGKYNVTPRIE